MNALALSNPPSKKTAVLALQRALELANRPTDSFESQPVRASAEELRALPIETLRYYLDQILVAKNADQSLDILLEEGILDVWLPEISAMVGFGDGEWRHKDVWKHTKQVVKQAVPRLDVRWGALLHDIGKLRTRSMDEKGEVHFFGHSEVGAAMFRKRVARRLGFEGALYKRIHFLILHHLRASQYDRSWTDSAVRRFAREMGDGLTDLLDLSRADITTKRPERRKRGLEQISDLAARIRKIQTDDAKVPLLPSGIGDGIMTHFGLAPSRKIGEIKHAIEVAIAAGTLQPHQEISFYLHWLEQNPTLLGKDPS